MAKAWIKDAWLKKNAPANVKRLVNSAGGNPGRVIDRIPDEYRTGRFGRGRRWVVCWYETVNGARVERNRSFSLKTDAEKFKTSIADDQYSGRYVNERDRNRLYRDVAGEYLAGKHGVKESTLRGYRRYLRMYALPKWGSRRIGDIERVEVAAWIRELRDGTAPHDFHGDRAPKDAPSGNYVKGVFKTAKAVMNHAKRNRLILDNPFDGVELPRDNTPDDDMVFLTYGQVERLAGECLPDDALLVRMLAYTGLRPNELLALHVADLDLDARRIHVVRNFTVDEAGRQVEGTPKTWENRDIAIPVFLIPDLREQCRGREPNGYVFTTERGCAVSLANWRSRRWRSAVRRSGLDAAVGLSKPYSLRHTYASLAIAAGCDVKTLQCSMGHKDATVTLNTYAALWPKRLDEVADAMGHARSGLFHQG